MSARIKSIDGITIAVGIGGLVEVGVPGEEPAHLGVVEPAPDQRQPRIPFRPVARSGSEHIRARAAPAACHRLSERRERQARRHRLARVRHRPLGAEAIKERRLPILADQGVPIGVGRRRAAALLLQQHRAAIVHERGRHPA